MLEWLKKRRTTVDSPVEPDAKSVLLKYLAGRYANAVVLTFAEIEDLLGRSLPERARSSEDWWTSPDPDAAAPRIADSWILANRTARPNLRALTVAFDRVS